MAEQLRGVLSSMKYCWVHKWELFYAEEKRQALFQSPISWLKKWGLFCSVGGGLWKSTWLPWRRCSILRLYLENGIAHDVRRDPATHHKININASIASTCCLACSCGGGKILKPKFDSCARMSADEGIFLTRPFARHFAVSSRWRSTLPPIVIISKAVPNACLSLSVKPYTHGALNSERLCQR